MTLNCNNTCKITGEKSNIERLHSDLLKSNYSMDKIIPLDNKDDLFEKAEKWGTGSIIELESSMLNVEQHPSEIELALLTNGPIEQFWRYVSRKYQVDILYSFYNESIEFIGIHKYTKGVLRECKYNENPKSEQYKDLILKGGFILPETNKATIISFEDLIKKGR